MKTLTDWYPGDNAAFATLEWFGMVAILIFAAWVVERTLARRRAALASSLWLAALIGVLLTPLLVLLGPRLPWRIGVLSSEHANTANSWDADADHEARIVTSRVHKSAHGNPPQIMEPADILVESTLPTSPPVGIVPPTNPTEDSAAVPSAIIDGRAAFTFFMAIWSMGSLWLAVRLVLGASRLRRLNFALNPFDSEIHQGELVELLQQLPVGKAPSVCVSENVRSPLVAGLLRPCIVLPTTLLKQGTPEQLRDVLRHECAHIIRRDPWIYFLQKLAGALFWTHPLIHLLQRRLNATREEVCDNHVLAHADAPTYASTLLSLAQLCYPKPHLKGYLTMMPRRQNLERRIVDLLDERRDTATRLPVSHRLAITAGLVLILAGVASVGLHTSAAQDHLLQKQPAKGDVPAKKANAETKPAGNGKISGIVLNGVDGSPVQAAEVRLMKRGQSSDEPLARNGITNARGEFTFEGLATGAYRIWSFHGNLISRIRYSEADIVEVADDGAAKPVTMKLQPGVTARVTVLDLESGKPIVDARVQLTYAYSDRDHFTDDKGQVEILALTPEAWSIRATAKDHAAVQKTLHLAAGETASVEFKLAPGGIVEGSIRGKKGEPIAGVGVNIYHRENEGLPPDYIKTGPDGRYRIEHLPVGGRLRLYAADSESIYLPLTQEFSIDPAKGRLARLDLEIKKRPHGGSIKGTVTDAKGQPIFGAELANHGGSGNEVHNSKTDAKGRFLIDDVFARGGRYSLVVKANGFAPRLLDFKPGSADNPTEITIPLDAGHRIKGRAVDEAGQPLANLRVFFAEGNRGFGNIGDSMRTDAQGRFEFNSLPPDTPFTFTKDAIELASLKLPLDGDKEVVVTLKSLAVIKGRVIDKTTGKSVPQFNVRIVQSRDHKPGDPSVGIDSERITTGEDFAASDGKFVLKQLAPGAALQVSVLAPGYQRYVAPRVVAQPASNAPIVDFELIPEDAAKLIVVSGKLVNHKDQPVSGAELRLFAAKDRPKQRDRFPFNWQMIQSNQFEQRANVLQVHRSTTKADGSFQFERIRGDVDVELAYWAKGIPAGRVDHVESLALAGRAVLMVKALAPGRVAGTIDRQVFPEISAFYVSGSLREGQVRIAADGKTFDVEDLPPGKYVIQIYGPVIRDPINGNLFQGREIGRRTLTLAEGTEERVELGIGDKYSEKK